MEPVIKSRLKLQLKIFINTSVVAGHLARPLLVHDIIMSVAICRYFKL